jgi:hypothetical protein
MPFGKFVPKQLELLLFIDHSQLSHPQANKLFRFLHVHT